MMAVRPVLAAGECMLMGITTTVIFSLAATLLSLSTFFPEGAVRYANGRVLARRAIVYM
jgi:hypothetical protein